MASRVGRELLLVVAIGSSGLTCTAVCNAQTSSSFQPSTASQPSSSSMDPQYGISDAMWLNKTSPSTYRILPRKTLDGQVPASPANPLAARPMEPYAYGWFGTQPTPDWVRSFGIRKSYTQWTRK